jgi:AAA family ATP:ADP antiporter
MALALFALVFSCVNTNGEYLLGKLTKAAASEAVLQGKIAPGAEQKFIGGLYGQFFFYVNLLGVLLQAFVVSRVVRFIGLRPALFILPVIALGDSLLVALMPVLAVIRIGKIAENATDYSLNNTLRQMLWLVTTRAQKYKAKQAVDTFFVRIGDVSSALFVWVLVSQLAFSVRAFAVVNAFLVIGWIFVMVLIVREHRKLERQQPPEPEATKA